MRRQWLGYGVVAVLGAGAGIAIAGWPDRGSEPATIVAVGEVGAEPVSDGPTTTIGSSTWRSDVSTRSWGRPTLTPNAR